MSDQAKQEGGQNDLAILYPEREAVIGGREVVMREYGFVEGLRLASTLQPIVDGMAALAKGGEVPDVDALRLLFADNAAAVVELIATACDQPREWVQSLDDEAGRELLLLWWGVNAAFFGRRVVQVVLLDEFKAFGGPTSSSPSAAATSMPSGSAGSPVAN